MKEIELEKQMGEKDVVDLFLENNNFLEQNKLIEQKINRYRFLLNKFLNKIKNTFDGFVIETTGNSYILYSKRSNLNFEILNNNNNKITIYIKDSMGTFPFYLKQDTDFQPLMKYVSEWVEKEIG